MLLESFVRRLLIEVDGSKQIAPLSLKEYVYEGFNDIANESGLILTKFTKLNNQSVNTNNIIKSFIKDNKRFVVENIYIPNFVFVMDDRKIPYLSMDFDYQNLQITTEEDYNKREIEKGTTLDKIKANSEKAIIDMGDKNLDYALIFKTAQLIYESNGDFETAEQKRYMYDKKITAFLNNNLDDDESSWENDNE